MRRQLAIASRIRQRRVSCVLSLEGLDIVPQSLAAHPALSMAVFDIGKYTNEIALPSRAKIHARFEFQ
ncbi:hypothetical protein [Rhizobium herbae]|uniref:Uncharacterized protein n=1 Tax=Rhizobium herbae TaxID=508661 RepID=A0ABS4EGC6_9HYPH|nr:hypothetical protein [Rhizobium herbae]MBP1857000.1 hypothetical protein [Rhizobium herbae]